MDHKYIRYPNFGFILWPRVDNLWHSQVNTLVSRCARENPISAGFATIVDGEVICFGESESMNLLSKPREDSEALKKQLNM